jgi:hypothetical protein
MCGFKNPLHLNYIERTQLRRWCWLHWALLNVADAQLYFPNEMTKFFFAKTHRKSAAWNVCGNYINQYFHISQKKKDFKEKHFEQARWVFSFPYHAGNFFPSFCRSENERKLKGKFQFKDISFHVNQKTFDWKRCDFHLRFECEKQHEVGMRSIM